MNTLFSFDWYTRVLKHYIDFSGRAKRREFWNFVLINAIIGLVLYYLILKVGSFFSFLYGLYSLAILLPGLGVSVRRLHDIKKSGWLILLGLIPAVGEIILVVLFCMPSRDDDNSYGSPAPLNPND